MLLVTLAKEISYASSFLEQNRHTKGQQGNVIREMGILT